MMHTLETEYGLLGGRRILGLLVEDTLALMEEFYPAMERVSSGDLVSPFAIRHSPFAILKRDEPCRI